MASSKLTQKAVSPLRVSPSDESIFSLAGPFVKKRTTTTIRPQQQSPKNMKVILTHNDVDVHGMGNLVYYNINHQYKCHSIFICVLSVERSTVILQFVFSSENCWQIFIFCTTICHAFWRWNSNKMKHIHKFNFSFLYCSVPSSIVPALQMWAVAIYGPCV